VSADIHFPEGISYIIGENSQGKSNLVEAIFFLGNKSSFRTSNNNDLINIDSNEALVLGTLERSSGSEFDIALKLSNTAPLELVLNGKRVSTRQKVPKVPVVAFTPEDLALVRGYPAIRRKYLDELAKLLFDDYGEYIYRFDRYLKQRNSLLSSHPLDATTLKIIDEKFVEINLRISEYRSRLIRLVETIVSDYYRRLGWVESVRLLYKRGWSKDLAQELEDNRSRDRDVGSTSVGVHRDDVDIFVDRLRIRTAGSQGQVRAVAVALRLAVAKLLHDIIGEAPVVVLDDVCSELDRNRSENLMNLIPANQVFVTGVEKCGTRDGATFYLERGEVISVG
jgi:DNA replication and repair protein RecF